MVACWRASVVSYYRVGVLEFMRALLSRVLACFVNEYLPEYVYACRCAWEKGCLRAFVIACLCASVLESRVLACKRVIVHV